MEKKLPQIKIREWNEKPRTKFRFIKIGDIFCYQFSEDPGQMTMVISSIA